LAAQSDPIREWLEQPAQRWLNVGFEPLSNVPFRASVTPIFEDLRIARFANSPGFTFRDKKIVQDGDDAFAVFISQSSIIEIAQHLGRDLRLGYGDATVIHRGATGRIGSRLGIERIAIPIPRSELVTRGARPEDAVMRLLPRRSEGLQLLRGYLRSIERCRVSGSLEVRETVRRHIIDLVALSVVPRVAIGESSLSAVGAARLNTALDHIARHFQEPELSVGVIARRQHISPRYLQRLFETSGKSFTQIVNELRLQKAFALLAGPHEHIALHVGFADISHFNRLFRSRFGNTPSTVRADAQAQ
jgi:AraC-like DNA-binding protein